AGADLCAQRCLLDARPAGRAEEEDGAPHGRGRLVPLRRGVRLRDVRVEPDGILVRLEGTGVSFGK
ncbi:hypothetical protein, partial [Streptomyces albidoflavus]|uniref:hypothetical protein n=1 Tax=Streptomyces albidoflavus TaxID=1886 RepID=UPI001C3EB66A